jgi:hypothetical protein
MNDFAAAALKQDSTKKSPFFIDRGYEPRVSFDWRIPTSRASSTPSTEDAEKWARRIEDIWQEAKDEIERAQAQQKQQANKHRCEEDFDVGDPVFITLRN